MPATVPNTVFEYTINSDGTFPNKRVDVPSFIDEIEASSINVALIGVTVVDGNCRIEFATNGNTPPGLTDAEMTTLDGLVAAHTAALVGEPHMLPYLWQVKNPVANQAATALKVVGLAGAIDEYNMMRPAVPTGVNIRLKNALTQGTLTVTIAKNDVATNRSRVIGPAQGRKTLWLLKTTDVSLLKGESLGLYYSTSSDMLPTADNELVCNLEVAWKTL